MIKVITSFERLCKKENQGKHHRHTLQNTDENIVAILLIILQKNDNSLNTFDDTYYQANILSSLLKCLNITYFKKISKEVVRFLNIEFFTHYEHKYLILVIFKYFPKYVNNHLELMSMSLKNPTVSIYKNKYIVNDPDLGQAFHYLKELTTRYKTDITFARIIFKQK